MASQKISQLTAATTSSGADLYPLVQAGQNLSITFSVLQAALAGATTPAQLPTITLTGDVTGSSAGGTIPLSLAASTVSAKLLTGFSVGANSAITATDSILAAFGKTQGQINNINSSAVFSVSATGPLSSTGGQNPTISIPSTTGIGAVVQATSPTLVTPALGTPSSVVLTNATSLPLTTGVSGILPIVNGGTGQSTANAGFNALSPMTTLGDLIYGAASGVATRLGGNTSASRNFLVQTGTGSVSAAPAWGLLQAGDIPDISATYVKQTQIGAASGVAPLNASGKIPLSYLPAGIMEYQGLWNPATNTPTVADSSGVQGYLYYVSTAYSGTVSGLNNPTMTNFQVGDLIIYNGTQWELSTTAAGVVSVNGAQGAVTVNAINQLTGDATTAAASGSQSLALTLATVNSNVGSFALANVTVNAKGLVTAVSAASTTGTGNVVLANSPSLTTPNLGTPSAVNLSNATALPLTTGVAGTLATGNGGTGNNSPYTAGSVIFAGAGGTSLINNATSFWWDNTNIRLGIGTNAPDSAITVNQNTVALPAGIAGTTPNALHLGGANGQGTLILIDSFANAANVAMRRADGTAAALSAVQSGEMIGQNVFYGYGATSYQTSGAAKIIATAAENFTDTTGAAYLSLYTRPSGTVAASTERVRIDQNGVTSIFNLTSAAPVRSSAAGALSNGAIVLSASSDVSGTLPISNGGTGQTTAAAARGSSGLNIDQRTAINNASYTALSTDRYIGQTGTLTAPITITLPAANSVNAGQSLVVQDESGSVTTANYISIAPAGTNNLNGANSAKSFRTAYQRIALYSDGVSNWYYFIKGIAQGGTGTAVVPTNGQLLIGNGSNYTVANLTAGSNIGITNASGAITIALSGTVPVANGGTGVTSVTTVPTASAFAGWDANSNLSANNLINGYATTATAAGTTTLTVASAAQQFFTGTTTQTVALPVVTTLANGQQFTIYNLSTGTVTVQTSGGNIVQAMLTNTKLTVTVDNNTLGTGLASWVWNYQASNTQATPISLGGTGTTTQFTQGSVLFAGANGVYSQNNAQLFWDNTNFRLGIGTAAPTQALDLGTTGVGRVGAIFGASSTPTIAYSGGAGTGPTTVALIGTQTGIYVQFTTGTGTSVGQVLTITLPITAPNYVFASFTPANASAAAQFGRLYTSSTNNTISLISTGTALGASTTFAFNILFQAF